MKDLMRDLIQQLNKYTKLYEAGTPAISDKQWDELYFQLVKLEEKSGITFPDSPTQIIHYNVVNNLNKVTHNHKMLSLDKTKDWNEFIRYFGDKDVVGMVKLDGLTCSLTYENGQLVKAETRGDGVIGEDILHNAQVVKSIPLSIPELSTVELDGEIICTYDNFKSFAQEYANPRNFAAGSIRLLDPKECEKRNLDFIAWNYVAGEKKSDSFIINLERLNHYGFTITPWTSSFDWDAKEYLIEKARELGYPIDGLVGRFTSISYGESLGSTSHHSKAAYAFKFYDENKETELLDIEWTLGRTGILTPVAVFKPIELEGTIVERASLHNVNIMQDVLGQKPHLGQKINIIKANQIIPQVETADTTIYKDEYYYTHPEFIMPTTCPICGAPTELEAFKSTTFLVCNNPDCSGKFLNQLEHYCSKKGLDIKGLSKTTLGKLIDWGWVESISDLYKLETHRTKWINQSGFGVKSVENVLKSIENSKKCELHKFIAALGIPLVGTTASKELIKYFSTWDDFIKAVETKYDFTQIPNFGNEISKSLLQFNYNEAKSIVYNYIDFIATEKIEVTNNTPLAGLNFVITGTLKGFKNRDALKSLIEQHGGKVTSSISKNTNYLINNDINSNSAKNKTAKAQNIPIISETEFIEMFNIQ